MALVEAVLLYKPLGLGDEAPSTPIARCSDPAVLRLLRDRALRQAAMELEVWQGVDPGLAALRAAEFERLAKVLAFLVPDDDPRPGLTLVKK